MHGSFSPAWRMPRSLTGSEDLGIASVTLPSVLLIPLRHLSLSVKEPVFCGRVFSSVCFLPAGFWALAPTFHFVSPLTLSVQAGGISTDVVFTPSDKSHSSNLCKRSPAAPWLPAAAGRGPWLREAGGSVRVRGHSPPVSSLCSHAAAFTGHRCWDFALHRREGEAR